MLMNTLQETSSHLSFIVVLVIKVFKLVTTLCAFQLKLCLHNIPLPPHLSLLNFPLILRTETLHVIDSLLLPPWSFGMTKENFSKFATSFKQFTLNE